MHHPCLVISNYFVLLVSLTNFKNNISFGFEAVVPFCFWNARCTESWTEVTDIRHVIRLLQQLQRLDIVLQDPTTTLGLAG